MSFQPSAWASLGFGVLDVKQNRAPAISRVSVEFLSSHSSLRIDPSYTARQTSAGDSPIDGYQVAPTDSKIQISPSAKSPNSPAPPSLPSTATPDMTSISALALTHEPLSPGSNRVAMNKSYTISYDCDTSADDELGSSDTDRTSLSYLSYSPPLRNHFQQADQARPDSSSDHDSGKDASQQAKLRASETVDSSRDSSVISELDVTNTSISQEPLNSHASPSSSDTSDSDSSDSNTSDTQASEREASNELEDRQWQTTSPSERGSPSGEDTESDTTSASPAVASTVKSTQSQEDSQTPTGEAPLGPRASTPDKGPSTPVWITTPTSQTGVNGDIAAISTKLDEIEDQLTEANEVRDQENIKITTLSSEAVVFEQQLNDLKQSRDDLFAQRRVLNKEIVGVKEKIVEAKKELEVKIRAVDPHVEARDKAQHSINELAGRKRKQEKKLEVARYKEKLEQTVVDALFRTITKQFKYGRGALGSASDADSDSNSDSDETTDSGDNDDSDASETGSALGDTDDEAGGASSEAGRSAAKTRPSKRAERQPDVHMDEFVVSYTKLAHKDPKQITMAEFSTVGQAFTRLNGTIKVEPDDIKPTIKPEIIKREPTIKTEPNTTPSPSQQSSTANIETRQPPIKREPSAAPTLTAANPYPALEDLSLANLTADELAEHIQKAQYHSTLVHKAWELLRRGPPALSPPPTPRSTKQERPNLQQQQQQQQKSRKRAAPEPALDSSEMDTDRDDEVAKVAKKVCNPMTGGGGRGQKKVKQS